MPIKLKLNTGNASAASPAPASEVAQTPGSSKLKLNFGGGGRKSSVASAAPTEAQNSAEQQAPKPKRKYNRKKKLGDDAEDSAAPAAAPSNPKKRVLEDSDSLPAKRQSLDTGLKLNLKLAQKVPPLAPTKLKLKAAALRTNSVTTPRLRVKHVGHIPHRPIGQGYDSEAEDAETDPSIEHQFILRMVPGDPSEYLRKMITERKVGLKPQEGGADLRMVFFDKEGRRAKVTVNGKHYAAVMVDLPCIIEGMKSWERKSWYKSADISQMLLVLGPVNNDEEAKNFPLPSEVSDQNWQYPHGITPPMHYVRKRRFRKRVNYRSVEAVDEEVKRLIDADDEVKEKGGITEFKVLDLTEQDDVVSQAPSDEQNGYDNVEGDYEEDDSEMIRMLEEGLLEGETEAMEQEDGETTVVSELPQDVLASVQPTTEGPDGHAFANGVTTDGIVAEVDTPTPAAGTGESHDEEESGDEESDEEEEHIDEAEKARQQEQVQTREAIAELETSIVKAEAERDRLPNKLLRDRKNKLIESLYGDLEIKKASLGEDA